MRLRKIKKIFVIAGAYLLSLGISGCSAFFGNDEFMITNCETSVDVNGDILLKLTFSSEDVEPMTIRIPKGNNGEDGIGISSIVPEMNADNTQITLSIFLTDNTVQQVNIPVIKGDKGDTGNGIKEISVTKENKQTKVTIFYTDESIDPVEFYISDGVDGVGIADIETSKDTNGRTKITITYTDEKMQPSEFYINDGVGVSNISVDDSLSTDDYYYLNILYSDGTSSPLLLPKPKSTKWYSGTSVPSNDIGNIDDFYLNEVSGEVYKKTNNGWTLLFSLKWPNADEYFTLTFNVNGGKWRYIDEQVAGSSTKNRTSKCKYGTYFLDFDSSYFECYREGYVFNGWWTDAEIDTNSGKLTKLTPIFSDFTFYANWIEQ